MIDIDDFLSKFCRDKWFQKHPDCFHPRGRMHHHQTFDILLIFSIKARVDLLEIFQARFIRLCIAMVKVND